MAIQIMSDLHLEMPKAYDTFEIIPKAPYLALLGDIGNIAAHEDQCLAFFTKQLKQFRVVLFVPGNHEAYESNWKETLEVLRWFEQKFGEDDSLGEFVLLDRTAYPESKRTVGKGLNDFYKIDDWDVAAHNEAHVRDLAWLNAQVAELEQARTSVAILTHWSPTRDPVAVEPIHVFSDINSGFSTDLHKQLCFTSASVKLWAFGHTHYNCDFTVERDGSAGPLRLLTNQRGYSFQQSQGFDPEKTVRL
ncbi:hypothetical protein HIM_06627 [Hirsutella minnesotensis 3608]|uniref:Calcineurin-like phosphoesterase domain-containing protein n=1 Tax=Hirsutella minnesotensis 3608 TaxID=1043627 RepID=A0A0F8A4P9_9HYPO|nr:hypothetical protein HIM_06627 [Hirsutella minnesotensis 3608]